MAFRGGGHGDRSEAFDMVRQFCVYFYRHIRENNVPQIETMYENTFHKISERHFQKSPWPPAERVMEFVDDDHVFGLLYKELTFRHLYARCSPTLEDRINSWNNYADLFSIMLQGNVKMELFRDWLWDMIDEFAYQFQSFAQYRGKVVDRSKDELETLRKVSQETWSIVPVLNFLQALVDKSGICTELEADGGRALFHSEGYVAGTPNVLRLLGYFSLIGLLRVHSLVGDYHSALKCLGPLNPLSGGTMFSSKVPFAHITLHYYAGFCYLMMKRYTDAARVFNTILAYITQKKQFMQRHNSYEQILKKMEQMYSLLALTVALSPSCKRLLDENVSNMLADRNNEKIRQMLAGNMQLFDTLFSVGCPKFITPYPPAFSDGPQADSFQDTYRLQLRLFLAEVESNLSVQQLKGYLQLYTSIPLSKLAVMMQINTDSLRSQLIALKGKQLGLQWIPGSDPSCGELSTRADMHFHLETDSETGEEIVIVNDSSRQKKSHVQYLARHIMRLDALTRDLESGGTTTTPQRPAAARA